MPPYQTLAELRSAMARQDIEQTLVMLGQLHDADAAEFCAQLPPREALALLEQLGSGRRAALLGHMPARRQLAIARLMDPHTLSQTLGCMDPDERTDLFKQLDAGSREQIMATLANRHQEDLRRLSAYAEGTAGAIMTSDFVTLAPELSAEQALATLRAAAPAGDTLYCLYVLNEKQQLQGSLTLRELILAEPDKPVSALMTLDVPAVTVDTPQEQVVRLIARYDLLMLPILDDNGALVGIVTADDAMDVAEAEATEDIHKGATVGRLEGGVGGVALSTLYRKRVGWLVLLVFANLFSGAGIAFFEDTIAAYVALVFFLPLLVGSGGNAGSQAATLMVRGLATGEVQLNEWGRMLGRELAVAAALGITMALAVSGLGYWRGGQEVAMVVTASMLVIVLIGSLIGMTLPFILNRIGLDPATASAPLVATMADACGVVIYFSIATAVLDLGGGG